LLVGIHLTDRLTGRAHAVAGGVVIGHESLGPEHAAGRTDGVDDVAELPRRVVEVGQGLSAHLLVGDVLGQGAQEAEVQLQVFVDGGGKGMGHAGGL